MHGQLHKFHCIGNWQKKLHFAWEVYQSLKQRRICQWCSIANQIWHYVWIWGCQEWEDFNRLAIFGKNIGEFIIIHQKLLKVPKSSQNLTPSSYNPNLIIGLLGYSGPTNPKITKMLVHIYLIFPPFLGDFLCFTH